MREFIEKMRKAGLVVDVKENVSADMQAPKMAAGTDKLLFFHNIGGHKAVMNLTASRAALSLALGIEEAKMVKTLADAQFNGKVVEDGTLPMQKVDLTKLPIMHHFPKDAGKYLTSAIVFSRWEGVENASIHRMQVLDDHRVAARLVEGRHTHVMVKKAIAKGEKLPIAITIGTHPAVTFASCTRVPTGMELPYAAELMGGTMKVKRCSNGVLVPDAEIVLEGFITAELTDEGPFVDITGTYDPIRRQHIIEFTGMYMKPDCIYHGILPGGDEHKVLMGCPYEPKIYKAVAGVTEVRNVVLTKGGCGYLHAVVQIKKSTQGDGKNAIMAAFAAHTSLKHVVVVDEDIDPTNPHEVEYAIATRVNGDRDIMVITGVRGSSLDPCQLEDGTNVKVGVDATMVLGHEAEFTRATW
ncbi:UbiD family decarboxylase [Methanoregula sp.]|uniref:UbiD family decarboxylase n=1 Tax=Methanoregula sp. TaxID=2052170 RepID=UPI00236A0199|nr:UbiD family decarboxylase [Methanoregula sp.]MDD1686151.1 UbiD family decarboxylase [Methanoregula sp.]